MLPWRKACFSQEAGPEPERRKAMSRSLTNCSQSPRLSDPVPLPQHEASAQRRAPIVLRHRKSLMALILTAATAFVIAGVAFAEEYHSNPWLLSWIPATCCVTNDCCWEVSERELRSLPDDEWEILSTGQVRKRTGWSPDGKFYRCACDYDSVDKHWIRHQGANTRCIFVPMRSAAASYPSKRPVH